MAIRIHSTAWFAGSLALLLDVVGAVGQGAFQNLGFESASPIPTPPAPVAFGTALPGWTGYVGGVQESGAVYNTLTMDGAGFGIIDSGFSNPYYLPGGLIQGNFTAVVMSGIAGPGVGLPADATLAQTGLVPAGTESLDFKAQLDGGSSFTVALGGQTLSLVPLQAGVNFTRYGADIHAWAGQVAELAFTAIAQRPHHSATWLYLDSIVFSSQAVPEPGVLGLSALGASLVGWPMLRRLRVG